MSLRRILISTSLACFLLGSGSSLVANVSAQHLPQTYSGTMDFVQSSDFPNQLFPKMVLNIPKLPRYRDSLDLLVPVLVKKMHESEKPVVPVWTNMQFSIFYSTLYEDYNTALVFNKREIEAIKAHENDLESHWLSHALSRRAAIMQHLGKDEETVLLLKKVEDRLADEQNVKEKTFGYRQLSIIYSSMNDHQRALEFCKKGVSVNRDNSTRFNDEYFYTTMAVVFSNQAQPVDTIIKYRKKAIAAAQANNRLSILRTAYRNLAADYSKLGERDSADKYFKAALEIFRQFPWEYGWRTFRLQYADHLVRMGKSDSAKAITERIIAEQDTIDYNNDFKTWQILAKIAAREGNYFAMEEYWGKADSIVINHYNKERVAAQEEMATKYQTEKKEAENAYLTAQNRSFRIQLILAGILAFGLLIIASLIFQKRKRDKQLAFQREEILTLNTEKETAKREQAEEKSRELQKQLRSSISRAMLYQNKNLELMEMIDEIKEEAESPRLQNKARFIQRKMQDYSTEEVLQELEQKAKDAYPDLYRQLQSKLSHRNSIELVYCIMLILGYSAEEIARTLQRSEKAVKSLRYRIRKKLDLSEEEELLPYLQNHIVEPLY